MGDGVMATFGTPEAGPDDAINALKAARQIVSDVDRFSRECAERGDPQFRVSVGVHFGPAILGDIGPARRLEFAVLGDTVNVASRLENATRQLNCRIVSSNDLIERIDGSRNGSPALLDGFQPVREVALRGRTVPIDVWTF
jgi:adenylate cyclase